MKEITFWKVSLKRNHKIYPILMRYILIDDESKYNSYILIPNLLRNNHLFSGDHGLSQDTANTLSLVFGLDGGNVNITTSTPRSTPRVLDDEGFQETDLLVANSKDGVVEVSATIGLDDTRAVELEDILISFNEDGNGEVNQSSFQLISGLGGDERVSSVDLMGLGRVEVALTIFSSVGIVRFEFKTILSGILDSEIRPASLATITSRRSAINDLLFREGEEFSVVDEVETFEDTGGGESPA